MLAVRTRPLPGRASTLAPEEPDPRVARALLLQRVVGFVLAFGLTIFLALDGGGFDAVVRDVVGIVVWAAVALGFATGFFPRGRFSRGAWIALGGLGVLTALTAVAHSWTESDEATTLELARVVQYLGIVTLAYLAIDRHTWQGAAAGFASAALVIPFFALGARLFPHLLVDDVARAFHFDRLSYPLDYWNAVSCWGAMAIAIGLCASAHGPRVLRAAALATIPVASLSIYLTFSRFGAVATAMALLAAFAVSRNRWTLALNGLVAAGMSAAAILIANQQSEIQHATGNAGAGLVISILLLGGLACATVAVLSDQADGVRLSRRGTRRALGAVALVTVLSAAALHAPISRGWDQFTHTGNVASGSTARFTSLGGDRYAYWRAAYHAFESDPGRGIGPGSFEFYWDRNGTTQMLIRNPHSLYLQKLVRARAGRLRRDRRRARGAALGSDRGPPPLDHGNRPGCGRRLARRLRRLRGLRGRGLDVGDGGDRDLGHGRRRCRRCLTVPPGCTPQRLGPRWAHVGRARRGGIPGAHPCLNRENAGQRNGPGSR